MSDRPARYKIAALLNNGVQPFADLTEDELDALGKTIDGEHALAIPISLSSDGILLDGHQRLKALAARRRTWIDAGDIRVIEQANAENAIEWAIQLNVQRRNVTTEAKAALARQLRRERHWSQRKIARTFAVTQPTVSQWLARPAPDDYEPPTSVVGEDGRRYVVKPRAGSQQKVDQQETPPRSMWLPDGVAFKAVVRARKLLAAEPLGGLDQWQLARLGQEVSDLVGAAEAMLNEITDRQ